MADLREQLAANYDKFESGEASTPVDTGSTSEHKDSSPVAATPSKSDVPAKVIDKAAKPDPKGQTAVAATPQGQAVHKPPSSWAAEYHEHFGKFDPRVQEYILQREKEVSDGISKYGDQLKKLEPLGAIEPLLAARRQAWASRGISDAQGLGKVFEMYDFAVNRPQEFHKWFANTMGIQAQDPDPYAEQSPEAIPPQVQQVIGGLQQRLEQFERAQQEQRNREFQAQVQAFATEKDEQGLPKRPHFEDVRQDIMGWFQTILQADPNLSFTQALDQAYDRSVWGNPNVRTKILESQKAREEEVRVKEQKERDEQGRFVKAQDAKKSAVKSEPPGQIDTGKKKDLRGQLSAKWDELSRAGSAV